MDAARIKAIWGEGWNVEQGEDLERVAESKVPVNIRQGGDMCQEMANGNSRSVTKCESDVLRKAVEGEVMGWAMVFQAEGAGRIDGLCISLMGEVEDKLRSVSSTI